MRARAANAAPRSSIETRPDVKGRDNSSRKPRKASSITRARVSSRSRAEISQRALTRRASRFCRTPSVPRARQPAPSARMEASHRPGARRPGQVAQASPRAAPVRSATLSRDDSGVKPRERSTERMTRIRPSRTNRRMAVTGSLHFADLADAPGPALRNEREGQSGLRLRGALLAIEPARPQRRPLALRARLVERGQNETQRRAAFEAAPQDQHRLVGSVITLPDGQRLRRQEGLDAGRERALEERVVAARERRFDRGVQTPQRVGLLRPGGGDGGSLRGRCFGRNQEEKGAEDNADRARDGRSDPSSWR